MSDLLPFVIVGIVSGSVYGLAGLGLVLTYKTTGIFNFAHGGIAAIAAYLFHDLRVTLGVPWPIAALLTVVGFGLLAGWLLEIMARSLAASRQVLAIVGTVGLLLLTQGALTLIYGAGTLPFPRFLPTASFSLGGVFITVEQVITATIGVVAAAGLLVFFRRSRLGVAMRAVVDDPTLLSLAAIPPTRVRTASWAVGSAFAALSGLLIAPLLGRDPILLTLLIVQAFGAAAIGRFASLPMTYLGGIIIGIGVSLTTNFVSEIPALSGLPTGLPFLVLLVALMVTPAKRLAGRGALPRVKASRPPAAWSLHRRAITLLAIGVATLLLPALVGTKLPLFIGAIVLAPMFLSLALLVWTSGQLSLGHAAFVALGASTFSLLTSAGVPWLVALPLAGLAVVPLGALVAIPAIRLSGIYLALATFGFGILMQRLVYGTMFMFGADGFRGAPRPALLFFDGADDRTFFFVVTAIVLGCFGAVAALQRGRLGRILRALGDSPTALVSLGVDANVARLLVFCIAGFLAGISGALSISLTGQVSVDTFGLNQSLIWLTVLGICGSRLMVGPLIAASLVVIAPGYLPQGLNDAQALIFGAAALLIATSIDRTYSISRRGAGRGRSSPVWARLAPTRAATEVPA